MAYKNVPGLATANTATITGATSVGGDLTVGKTLTSATPATERLTYTTLTVNSATDTFAIGGGTGSLVGIRGEVKGTAGDTLTAGFIYGTQGKLTAPITFGNDGKVTALLGQADLTSATVNAGGQASGVWADLQGNPTIADDSPGQVFPLRVTNSMSVDAGALALFYGKADYFFVADADGHTADWIATPAGVTPGATRRTLKVQVGGQVLYILAANSWT